MQTVHTARNMRKYLTITMRDIYDFLKARKKWWLAPIIIVLLVSSVLVIASAHSAAAPFLYTIF
jgi:predicted signal transduction protein with EAL and GGDEF domain